MAKPDDKYRAKLIDAWEEVYKKGQLTLWVMLAIKDKPRHMSEIMLFINNYTNNLLNVEEQSLYRALRRHYEAEMIDYQVRPGKRGPDRKYYYLTDLGKSMLYEFVKNNVNQIFYNPKVTKLLKGVNK